MCPFIILLWEFSEGSPDGQNMSLSRDLWSCVKLTALRTGYGLLSRRLLSVRFVDIVSTSQGSLSVVSIPELSLWALATGNRDLSRFRRHVVLFHWTWSMPASLVRENPCSYLVFWAPSCSVGVGCSLFSYLKWLVSNCMMPLWHLSALCQKLNNNNRFQVAELLKREPYKIFTATSFCRLPLVLPIPQPIIWFRKKAWLLLVALAPHYRIPQPSNNHEI